LLEAYLPGLETARRTARPSLYIWRLDPSGFAVDSKEMLHANVAHRFRVHPEVRTRNRHTRSHFGKFPETDPEKKEEQNHKTYNERFMFGERMEKTGYVVRNWDKLTSREDP
jgi:hypothetical protein